MSVASRSDDRAAGPVLEERLRFEAYLAGVAAHFLSVPPEAVEGAIPEALRGLVDVLDVDRCGIALFTEGVPGLHVLYTAVRPGIPEQPRVDLESLLPWYAAQLRQGRALVWSRLPE